MPVLRRLPRVAHQIRLAAARWTATILAAFIVAGVVGTLLGSPAAALAAVPTQEQRHAIARMVVPAAPAADTAQAGLAALNRVRMVAGLAPTTLSPTGAAALHAHYLAVNAGHPAIRGLRSHTEEPALPGYTKEGAAVAARSNIVMPDGEYGESGAGSRQAAGGENAAAVEAAIEGLVEAPLHRHLMLSPALTSIDVGGEDGVWVIDLGSALGPTPERQARVVAYPAPGQQAVGLTFSGREVPDPLSVIPGLAPNTTVGYPISLHFFGCDPRAVQGSLARTDGTPVPSYLIKPGTDVPADGGSRTIDFPLLFSQQPLAPATTYVATVTATCGVLGARTYTWPFTTRAALASAATSVVVAPRGTDGWQAIKAQLIDTAGLPVVGAMAGEWEWEFSYSASAAAGLVKPQLRLDSPQSDHQGVVSFDFHLGDATKATVTLGVEYDGQKLEVKVPISPAGSGAIKTFPPPGAIPFDRGARGAWEQAHGAQVVGTVA